MSQQSEGGGKFSGGLPSCETDADAEFGYRCAVGSSVRDTAADGSAAGFTVRMMMMVQCRRPRRRNRRCRPRRCPRFGRGERLKIGHDPWTSGTVGPRCQCFQRQQSSAAAANTDPSCTSRRRPPCCRTATMRPCKLGRNHVPPSRTFQLLGRHWKCRVKVLSFSCYRRQCHVRKEDCPTRFESARELLVERMLWMSGRVSMLFAWDEE